MFHGLFKQFIFLKNARLLWNTVDILYQKYNQFPFQKYFWFNHNMSRIDFYVVVTP